MANNGGNCLNEKDNLKVFSQIILIIILPIIMAACSNSSHMKEISHLTWAIDLSTKDGWYNTGIPVTANQNLLITGDKGIIWAVRIADQRFYNDKTDRIFLTTTEAPEIKEGVGITNLPPDFKETIYLRLDLDGSPFATRLIVKLEDTPCPNTDEGHSGKHQVAKKWASEKMSEIANN